MRDTNSTADQSKRRFFARKDLIIIAALLLISAAGFLAKYLFSDPQATAEAEIYYKTKIVKTVLLHPGLNEKFAVPGQPDVVLQVSDGRICFYYSTCKDKICIKAGFLSRPGETAACLPNKVAIKIIAVGDNNSIGADTYAT